MLLRKQTSFFQTFETTMEFSAWQAGAEAGIALWWSQFSYATIGIKFGGLLSDSGKPHVVSRSPKGRPGEFHVRLPLARHSWTTCQLMLTCCRWAQTTSSEISAGLVATPNMTVPARLTLACEGSVYTLSFNHGDGGGQTQVSCSAEDLTTMPPVGGAFTGVMFGVYAFGRGKPLLDPADFTKIRVSTRDT